MKKISILIPVYNEINTLKDLLVEVNNADFCGLEKEIILIDDVSTDGTRELLSGMENEYRIFYHDKNQGKGSALRTGIKESTGDIIVIQDADLEYNPQDYSKLVEIILNNEADVCYGSRILDGKSVSNFMPSSLFANKVLTLLTNILYGKHLTDMETCYKAFKSDILKNITIKSDRFDFEPEITAKVFKSGARIKELPISYNGRKYAEGKKITWKDGVCAILAILKFRIFN